MASRSFQAFSEIWNRALTGGMDDLIGKIIGDNATLFASTGVLAVMVLGYVLMSRSDGTWAKAAILRIAAISALMTVANFNMVIREPLMNDIPNFIASAAFGGNSGAAPERFDQIADQIEGKKAEIFQEASGFLNIDIRIYTSLLVGAAYVVLWMAFGIWMLSTMLIGLLVYAAPFLLGFYLFDATRHITLGLASAAVSVLLMMLFVTLLVRIGVEANFAFAREWAVGGRGVLVQIAVLEQTVGFFFGTLLLIGFAPILAGRIAGGVAPVVFSGRGLLRR